MTVLIGYVPTPEGESALRHGIAEAALRGTDVVILNSPRRGATVDATLLDEATVELIAAATQHGVSARVDHALPGSDIVATFESLVASTGADLLVIGLRHRSPVGKLVMGSDAQRLLLDLSVPILAVKASAG